MSLPNGHRAHRAPGRRCGGRGVVGVPRLIAALAGIALATLAAPARADCASDCESAYYSCGGDRDFCLSQQGVCLSRCGLESGERYGAIAYSARKGVYGYSYDYDSRNEAAAVALGYCRKQDRDAGDCEVLLTFSNACGALALGDEGAWGSSWGWTAREADANAVAECRPYGGASCRVERTVCSGVQ